MSGLRFVYMEQKHRKTTFVKFAGIEKEVDRFHLLSRISLWASLTD